MDRSQLVVLGLGLIIGLAIYWFSRRSRAIAIGPWNSPVTAADRATTDQISAIARKQIEMDFRKVFMTTSTEGKEALIKQWMDRKKCGRPEAMRLAVEEWRRENR